MARARSLSDAFCFALAIGTAVMVAGCGGSPITAERVQRAFAPTFANLVHTQVDWLGLPPMSPSQVGALAQCRSASGATTGSGEWVCTVIWRGPEGQSIGDAYDLLVGTDGCFTASVANESLGGPTLRNKNGKTVRNLLYAFESCFDTTT